MFCRFRDWETMELSLEKMAIFFGLRTFDMEPWFDTDGLYEELRSSKDFSIE